MRRNRDKIHKEDDETEIEEKQAEIESKMPSDIA